ncbi:hypothetical protein BD289DRAFT_348665, partial [Coniella lustricola]
FTLSFQSFLCVYAAYQYINPTTILLHTDYPQASIDRARTSGSLWTRKILTSFPNTLHINPVTPPTAAGPHNDIPLDHIEHKSDFVRMAQLALHGGVYLDWDVLTLRSPAPLLNAGFKAVVGRQVDGLLNNGCVLARRDAALVALLNRDMPFVFSGEWQAHSTELMTAVAERIAYVPGEVLILDHMAFAPTSWYRESATELFAEHETRRAGNKTKKNKNKKKAEEQVEDGEQGDEWEMDFSQTYFLHAFKADDIPKFEGIDVAYVLRRRSNYALAAWPLVMQAIQDGLIGETD